jgi:hypothetical protein
MTYTTKVGGSPEEPDEGKPQVRFCEGAHSNPGAITPKRGGYEFYSTYFMYNEKNNRGGRRAFNHLFPLRAPLRTLRLYSVFGYSMPHVPGSSCIVKSLDSGLGT